LWYFVW